MISFPSSYLLTGMSLDDIFKEKRVNESFGLYNKKVVMIDPWTACLVPWALRLSYI